MVRATTVIAILASCVGCRQLFGFEQVTEAPSDADLAQPDTSDARDAPVGAWLDPWMHRKSITLDESKIEAPSNGALVDFPVLISISDPEILAGAAPGGADIVFTAGDGVTLLESEIEQLSPQRGLVAWVKVPSLSATANTPLFVYYANSGPQPPPNPNATWTASYLAVWHLQEDPGPGTAGDIRDASPNNRNGTTAPAMTAADLRAGQIGNAIHFNDTTFIDFSSANFGNAFTISAWVNLQAAAGTGVKTVLANSVGGFATNGFRFFINSSATADRRVLFETGNGTTGSLARTNVGAIQESVWTQVAVTVDRLSATARIFVNGVDLTVDSGTRNDFATSSDFEIGGTEGDGFFFGDLDEVVVASTLRPAEWLLTAFRNQSSPATFFTFGPEETK